MTSNDRLRRLAAGLIMAATVAAGPGWAEPLPKPRLLIHLAPTHSKVNTCSPNLTDCANATVYGLVTTLSVEIFYAAYVVVTGFDTTAGLFEVNLAVDYDRGTNAGVDVFAWTTCGATSLGNPDWYATGTGNQIRWDNCPKSALVIAGYFYITAYSPGKIGLIRPAGAEATVQSCGADAVTVPADQLGFAGFGDQQGCTPCDGPCEYVAVEPTTWGSLKAQFRDLPAR